MPEDNARPAPAAAESTPVQRSVGDLLRAARDAQGLSLEQISTELRIEMPQLAALEGDRFERIGVPVFVKGYLRQYGARLGLDYRDLIAQYYKQTQLPEVQIRPSKTIKLHDERQIAVWVIAALAVLVAIVGLAVWWLGGGGFNVAIGPSASPAGSDGAKPAAASPAAAAPAASDATKPAADSAAPAAEPASPPASAPATPVATASGASNAPSATTTPAAVRPVAARGASAGAPSAGATNAVVVATNGAADGAGSFVVPLELAFDQESWVEVTDAHGERLYYGLGTAGRRAQLRGEPPFAVVLGNAAGVKVVVDGEDFPVPATGRPGEYARFSVNVTSD